jgi:hypothetical protein
MKPLTLRIVLLPVQEEIQDGLPSSQLPSPKAVNVMKVTPTE